MQGGTKKIYRIAKAANIVTAYFLPITSLAKEVLLRLY